MFEDKNLLRLHITHIIPTMPFSIFQHGRHPFEIQAESFHSLSAVETSKVVVRHASSIGHDEGISCHLLDWLPDSKHLPARCVRDVFGDSELRETLAEVGLNVLWCPWSRPGQYSSHKISRGRHGSERGIVGDRVRNCIFPNLQSTCGLGEGAVNFFRSPCLGACAPLATARTRFKNKTTSLAPVLKNFISSAFYND